MARKQRTYNIIVYGFYFLAAYLPWQIALNPASQIDLASVRVIVLVLAILYFFEGNSFAKIRQIASPFFSLGIFWLAILALSALFAGEKIWAARKFIYLFNAAIIYPVAMWVLFKEERVNKFFNALLYSSFVASIFALIVFFSQFIFGWEALRNFFSSGIGNLFWGSSFAAEVVKNPSWVVNVGGRQYFRALGLFPDPHSFALFIGFVLPFSISLLIKEKKRIYMIFSLTFLATLFLTFSRSGYVGMLFGLIITLIFFYKFLASIDRKILGGILAVILLAFLLPATPISSRFYSSIDVSAESNYTRVAYWETAIRSFIAKPVLGVGLGNFPKVVDPSVNYRGAKNAHNTHLEFLAEGGVLAFLSWSGMWYFALRHLFYGLINKNWHLAFAVFWSLSWFFIANIFETGIYSIQSAILLFVFFSLCLCDFTPPEGDLFRKTHYGRF